MEERNVKLELLDFLAFKVGCMYLSDLRTLKKLMCVQRALRDIDPSMFGLEEWNDAVSYITGKDISFSTCEQAVQYLLSY